jgi:hypothetical protein
MQELAYNNVRSVFSMRSVPRCYKQGTRLELSPVGDSEEESYLQELAYNNVRSVFSMRSVPR